MVEAISGGRTGTATDFYLLRYRQFAYLKMDKVELSFQNNGERHEFYERRFPFYSCHSEQVSTSSYLPTFVGAKPATADEVFRNVTNFLSQSSSLWVSAVERTDDAITWEWSSPSQSGIEKIVSGASGVYRLTYACRSASLSPKQRRTWVPVIKGAKLVRRAG